MRISAFSQAIPTIGMRAKIASCQTVITMVEMTVQKQPVLVPG
jgi:hypothetical protein